MAKPFIRNSAFLYALKIWLTSLVLGPFGWYLAPHSRDEVLQYFHDMFYYASIVALWYSWPCFLLLWLEVYVVEKRVWGVGIKKLATSVVCLFLALAAIRGFMWDGIDEPKYILCILGSYVVSVQAGVWVWKWPGRAEEAVSEQSLSER